MAWYPALAQESVSRLSSCISSKLDDVASRSDIAVRLEIAVSRVQLAIERSGKLPVTDVSLLRQKRLFRAIWIEGEEILRKHKQQQVVTSSLFLGITRARNNSIVSLLGSYKGYLCSSTVKKFEQYAELADKFLKDVESGFSLRSGMISNPLLRLLFEWKTIGGLKKNGTSESKFVVWPTHFEERGVEAWLAYAYDDPKMPEKKFHLVVGLRLSESTDIIGTAIRCLQPMVSQFKDAAEFAIGELSQLATGTSNLLDSQIPREDSLVSLMQVCAEENLVFRPDPICCLSNEHGPCGDNMVSSSELSHIIPVEVSLLMFGFRSLLEKEKKYRLRSSFDVASMRVMLPLTVQIFIVPHLDVETFIKFGSIQGYGIMGIRELLDTVGSRAMQRFLHQPELICYENQWFSEHGAAYFRVTKPTTRRSAKRKR